MENEKCHNIYENSAYDVCSTLNKTSKFHQISHIFMKEENNVGRRKSHYSVYYMSWYVKNH